MIYKNEDEFSRAYKAGETGNLFLLYGAEEYLVDAWKSRIIKPFSGSGAFNLQRLEGRGLDCDSLYDAVEALPLLSMSDQKCVVVEDLEVSKMPAAQLDKLLDILSDLPPGCVLVITGKSAFDPKSANGKKVVSQAGKSGSVAELGARGQAGLTAFLRGIAKRNGTELSADLAHRILAACGNDMNTLRCEMEKICAYTGYSGAIAREHVEAVTTPHTEARVFDLGKAILAGNAKRAMEILAGLLELREQPIAILSTLILSYVDLYRARVARDSGSSQAEMTERFGYKGREFRVRSAWGGRLSPAALRSALEALYDCDRKMKSTGIDDKVLLEQTVIRLFRAGAQR